MDMVDLQSMFKKFLHLSLGSHFWFFSEFRKKSQ
jgi:hypothetical protein